MVAQIKDQVTYHNQPKITFAVTWCVRQTERLMDKFACIQGLMTGLSLNLVYLYMVFQSPNFSPVFNHFTL